MMSEKKPNLKTRLFFLYVFSFISSTAPLLVCFILNWSKYTKTPGETVKLCAGGSIVLIFVFLKVIGKLQMPRGIVLFGVVFILTYLLQSLLNDLLLLSGMAFLGELIDCLLFRKAIKLTKENITVAKTADATAAQVEAVIKKYTGRL